MPDIISPNRAYYCPYCCLSIEFVCIVKKSQKTLQWVTKLEKVVRVKGSIVAETVLDQY